MLLRRITKHYHHQNWFAVFLDFCIVVIGVGVALAAGEWINARAVKADLKRAESIIYNDVYANYLNALERLAMKDCYAEQIRGLAERLKATDDPWSPIEPMANGGNLQGTLGTILRSPFRGWPTDAWETARDSGLLIYMDPSRRTVLSGIFSASEHSQWRQTEIFRKQAGLKALTIASELSAADRLRYYDVLAEIDATSALLETASGLIIQRVESLDIVLDPEAKLLFLDELSARTGPAPEVYGACYVPITLADRKAVQP